jgi:hypothetical protein
VRVQLQGGGEAEGELEEYVPGDHLTIDVGDRRLLRVAADSAVSVQIGAQADAAGRERSVPVDANIEQSARLNALLSERQYWQHRYTGLAVPVTMTAIGVASLVASAVFIAAWRRNETDHEGCLDWQLYHPEYCDENVTGPRRAGLGLAISGAVLVVGAAAFFALRTSERRQKRELERIDRELRTRSARTSIVPWFAVNGSSTFGLSAALRF